MSKAKVWKMGNRWAGISARGKRVVKDTKSAAAKAVGLSSKSKSTGSKTKSIKRKRGRTMARKKGRRRQKMTIPIAPMVGLLVGMMDPILSLVGGDPKKAVDHLAVRYVGFSTERKKMELAGLKEGLLPLIVGLLVHKFVGGTMGVNRMLGRSRVPLLRL